MKRMILLSMVGVSVLAVYALAQRGRDARKPVAPSARAQPQSPGMRCCPGCMMGRQPTDQLTSAARFTCSMHPAVRKAAAGRCPMCGMALVKGTPGPATRPQGMMTGCMAMMQKAGVRPATMKRMQVMMQTPIFMDSPCAIYGQTTALGLSDEQKSKLIEIENQARKKALAVLTAEQRKKMGDIPDKPMAMMQICRQMCARMMPMMQKMMAGKGGPMMMCPMMQMMGGQAGASGPSTKPPQ